MSIVNEIEAYQILNSRGEPTTEVKLTLENQDYFGSCPSGISRGSSEAIEIRDKDFSRFHGREVGNAVSKINQLVAPLIKGKNPIEQTAIDHKLIEADGTPNKANLGTNTTLPVSIAVAKAGATVRRKRTFAHLNSIFNELVFKEGRRTELQLDPTEFPFRMPRPAFLMLEGGQHGHNNLAFQEYLLIPQEKITPFWEKVRLGAEVFHSLGELLTEMGAHVGFGQEGAFIPTLDKTREAIDLIIKAAKMNNYQPHRDFTLGLDVAGATPENGQEYFLQLSQDYPIEVLEDPFPESAWEEWKEFTPQSSEETYVIGDDLTVTNLQLVEKALSKKAVDGIVIKPNQIGTVTETLEVAKVAKTYQLKTMVSHRGGDTNDPFIADLAVAIGADFIKTGAPNRGERVAKYNRLLAIDRIIN